MKKSSKRRLVGMTALVLLGICGAAAATIPTSHGPVATRGFGGPGHK